MAEGAWPVDPGTEVGWLRIAIDDADGVPHDPQDGKAEFTYLSDAALQSIIDLYPDDRPMQIGTAYQRIGMALARAGQRVRVDDIEIDTRSQADSYLALAKQWFETAGAAGSDAFEIVPVGTNQVRRPEGTQWPYGVM